MATEQTSVDASSESDEVPSFASPIQPQELEGPDERLILVWGRIWGHTSGPSAGLFVSYNVSASKIDRLVLNFHDTPDPLDDYDPDQTASEFLRTLHETNNQTKDPSESDQKIIRSSLEQSLEQPDQFEAIVDALEAKKRQRFKDWAHQLMRSIYKTSDCTFQLKGRIVSKSLFDGADVIDVKEEPKNLSDKPAVDEDNEEANTDERHTVNVNFVTSPVNGKEPAQLDEDAVVHARVVGDVVENLPDSIVDENREKSTVPLPCQLENRERKDNNMILEVAVEDGIKGVGEISPDSRVKISKPDQEADESDNLFPEVVLGLLLLTAVLLLLMQL